MFFSFLSIVTLFDNYCTTSIIRTNDNLCDPDYQEIRIIKIIRTFEHLLLKYSLKLKTVIIYLEILCYSPTYSYSMDVHNDPDYQGCILETCVSVV